MAGRAVMPGTRILVIGYGNPGRCDDGLGPALVARLESLRIPGLSVEVDYQLSIEHAARPEVGDLLDLTIQRRLPCVARSRSAAASNSVQLGKPPSSEMSSPLVRATIASIFSGPSDIRAIGAPGSYR